uniref:Acyltransferase 3 domain-containing protein n=1 Tax=Anopheles culicifacies TaxID=139723 RepID=A0A182MTZ0_9DIPT
MNFGRIVLVVTLQITIQSVRSVSAARYDGQPALYELDDWSQCDIAPARDWYCVVRVILTGDAVTDSSSGFEVNDLKRFRRTLLDRGICLTSSQRDASAVHARHRTGVPTLWNKHDRYILNRTYFPPSMQVNALTELAASDVINRRIEAQYRGLSAYTEIEYCLKTDPKPQFEQAIAISLAVTLVLGCVLLLNARRTLRMELKPRTERKSIKQFALFDLYKCFGSVGVVLAHCCLFGPFLVPMQNIELLEEVSFKTKFNLLHDELHAAYGEAVACRSYRSTYIRGDHYTSRLIRLVPLNLLLVGFATFAYDRFSGGGPLGARQLIMEQGFCRSRWWMNVLFVSNFNMDKPCLPDSWYVSADMQLYVLITLAIKTMFRVPKHTTLIVTFMAVCSFLGPFLTVLWTDFDPIGPDNLHEMRFFLLGSNFMSKLYTPFYNNLAWSVGGMIAGIAYDRFQRTDPNSEHQKKMLRCLNLVVIMLLALLVLSISATIAASNDHSHMVNRWWLAMCYAMYKLFAAFFIAASFLRIILAETDDYELMPPLFEYENMTTCFEEYPKSVYCVVKTVLKPMEHSHVWQAIEKYSKNPSYHEHALLDRGMCVDACVSLVNSLNSSTIARFDTERITVKPYLLLSIPSERELPQHQSRYGRILNICVNYHLQQRHNLIGYSELERCTTAESHRPTVDAYHVVFLLIVVVVCGAVVYATYTDYHMTISSNNNNDDDETQGHVARGGSLWMEFSLRRTWSQLVAAPKSNLQRDFAFVEIFRMLSVLIILAIHVSMCYTAGPVANMRPLEEFYGLKLSLMSVSVFPFQVHTFFTISGVMLAVHFLEYASAKGKRIGWSFLAKGIVMRYMRIFPVLFVVWLYQVSWFDWFARGPGDYRYFNLEKDNCRANGWLNFLFLNNYFRFSNMCMQQTWHLAADFQFFLAGLPLLLLINLFYAHPSLENDYVLSHPHTCSYFSGLFAGLAYHRYRTAPVPILSAGKTAWLLKWVPPTMVLLQATFSPLFYGLDYSEPMLWNAIYGAIHRCCWGAMCATGILYGATTWQGRHSWIHFHPVLQALSKLSFGVFMVQFNVLKSLTQNATGSGIDFNWTIYVRKAPKEVN